MHSFYAVSDVGDGRKLLKLLVEEMNDPNDTDTAKRTYQLQNFENQQSKSVTGSGIALSVSLSTADIDTVSDLFAAVKSRDANFKPKDASKPHCVVHGDR